MQVIYRLPGSALQGTYSFGAEVASRAFSPRDGGEVATPPWQTDPLEIYIWPSMAFTVIDAD